MAQNLIFSSQHQRDYSSTGPSLNYKRLRHTHTHTHTHTRARARARWTQFLEWLDDHCVSGLVSILPSNYPSSDGLGKKGYKKGKYWRTNDTAAGQALPISDAGHLGSDGAGMPVSHLPRKFSGHGRGCRGQKIFRGVTNVFLGKPPLLLIRLLQLPPMLVLQLPFPQLAADNVSTHTHIEKTIF